MLRKIGKNVLVEHSNKEEDLDEGCFYDAINIFYIYSIVIYIFIMMLLYS